MSKGMRRWGDAFCLAHCSSKSNDYTTPAQGKGFKRTRDLRVMLSYNLWVQGALRMVNKTDMAAGQSGAPMVYCDGRIEHGIMGRTGYAGPDDMNYSEGGIFDTRLVLPAFVVVYKY